MITSLILDSLSSLDERKEMAGNRWGLTGSAVALSALVPGARFASEEQTLARLGFGAAERARLAPLVTQRARTGEVNPALAPPELRRVHAVHVSFLALLSSLLFPPCLLRSWLRPV